jgi:hypothetical protein
MDTLAVRLAVPLTGSAEDFPSLGHFQGVRPAGRTKKKALTRRADEGLVHVSVQAFIRRAKPRIC